MELVKTYRLFSFFILNTLSVYIELRLFDLFLAFIWRLTHNHALHILLAILTIFPFMLHSTLFTFPFALILKVLPANSKKVSMAMFLLSSSLSLIAVLIQRFHPGISYALFATIAIYSGLFLLKNYEIAKLASNE